MSAANNFVETVASYLGELNNSFKDNKVKKRNGQIVPFDLVKIYSAIDKCFGKVDCPHTVANVTYGVSHALFHFDKYAPDYVFTIEEVQDAVEMELMRSHPKFARKYIIYREQRAKAREDKKAFDVTKIMRTYLDQEDWRVKENSNSGYSIGGLIHHNASTMVAHYWLNNVYPKEVKEAHVNCDIHIHDLGFLGAYCFTGDTKVRLLDNTTPTFEELFTERSGEEIWGYAYDLQRQGIVPAKFEDVRVTRYTQELALVVLDNGEVIKCTPDHMFLTKDDNYVQARNLTVNQSLKPLYTNTAGKYLRINATWLTEDYCTGKPIYAHRWVMENILGRKLEDTEIVHHVDGNKHNNSPTNLRVMDDLEHRSMELKEFHAGDSEGKELWRTRNAIMLKARNTSEKQRAICSAHMKAEWQRRREVSHGNSNHRVVGVSIIELPTAVPMYDLTVPKYHNFALDHGVFVHNCQGHALGQLIQEGLHGINGNLSSSPAKHLQALVQHIVNFTGISQNESAGAQAFSSVDTYVAPFIAYDNLTQAEVKQNVQSLLFGLNIPSRWSSQSPFSNVTLDLKVNPVLKDRPVIIGGKWWKKPNEDMVSVGGAYVPDMLVDINSECYDPSKFYTYGDFQKEMDMFNTAFFELMCDGDNVGRIFSYPIPTINITKEFDWDSPVANLLWKLTGKYGTPYFSNFINSDMKPEDSFSLCCRLRLDKRELRRRGGGLFGASERTGSLGVVTINLPRIAYRVKKELGDDKTSAEYTEAYKTELNKLLELARDSLEIKRKTVNHLTEQGLFPYTKAYLKTWNNHFSTIGILGMNEACLNLLGKNIADPEARSFALGIGDFIRDRISDFQEETGNLYNYESTPGEGTSYRFAKNDKKQFPDIVTAGDPDGDVYYTNSTNLPVGHTDDIFEALDHQDDFMVQYTGGCVFHGMLGEAIDNPETVKKLVKHIAERYRLPYFSITPTFSVCKQHGYLKGKQPSCPTCNEDTEVYSRIVGYYRPVSNWHKGKKQEFKDRVTYAVPELESSGAT